VVYFFCLEEEPLPLGRAGVVVLLLELEEPLPDLLSDLFELDLCFGLPEDLEAWVSQESSPFHSQYCASIAWTSFRILQGCLACCGGPYCFYMFGESIVSLSSECCMPTQLMWLAAGI